MMGFRVQTQNSGVLNKHWPVYRKHNFRLPRPLALSGLYIFPFKWGLLLYTFTLLFFTILVSCNESFEPLQENDKYFFTIYGFLDATTDTQWVRVAPVRGEFNMPHEKPEMQVALQHVEKSTSVVMNDTIIQFGQGFNALNVWSTMEIDPGQTYRLSAELPDGHGSQVTVTLPEEFPTPRLFIEQIPEQAPKYFLWIEDVERLADIQSRWYVRLHTPFWEEKRMVVISLKAEATLEPNGSYTLQMFPDEELEEIRRQSFALFHPDSEMDVLYHQLFVASGGLEWEEDISSIDDLVYNLPDGFSNIENGLGYMVGIVSKLIPFESCRDENGELVGCPPEKPFW